jgi:glutamate 5-kinase
MYDGDPRRNVDARLITEVAANDTSLEAMAAGTGGSLGRGGMLTKVRAARLAARSGALTLIAPGRAPEILQRIAADEPVGTRLYPSSEPLAARKQWLAGQLQVRGRLVLDAGAVRVLSSDGKSLLPVGVVQVSGEFGRGDLVACISPDGVEIARGLVNYSAEEAQRIIGQSSNRIQELLGYIDEPELIHRDNLVLMT